MLNPSMQTLMKKIDNRYLLVNIAAQRARDIAIDAEENEERLTEKPVKLALDEIADGRIEYRSGPQPVKSKLDLSYMSLTDNNGSDDTILE